MIKRIIKSAVFIFAAVLLLLPCCVLSGGTVLNNREANRIEKALSGMPLPDGVEFVEAASFAGNTSGTGNHVEIWAGILIRTDLDENEIRCFFDGYNVFAVPCDLTDQMPYQKDFIDFQSLNGKTTAEGYFVISKYYDALTQADLRGH